MSDRAFVSSYRDPVPLELPSGEIVTVAAPTVRQAAEFIGLLETAGTDRVNVLKLVDKFGSLLTPEDREKVEALCLADFFVALDHFFSLRGTPPSGPNGKTESPSSSSA